MKITLISHTPDPEKLVAAAAKVCYSSSDIDRIFDNLNDHEAVAPFIHMLVEMGHESPLEHISFTFGIEGVSRSLLAQITRHRIASFSVQSQRYVKENNFQHVTPPAISDNPAALERYEQAMDYCQAAYDELFTLLYEGYCREYEKSGGKDPKMLKAYEKTAMEDARFVLPNASCTKMMVTMNARSLLNFFSLRCCARAQWEIHAVGDEMLRLVKQVAPVVFEGAGPGCMEGSCPEGKMTCGRAIEVREKYNSL